MTVIREDLCPLCGGDNHCGAHDEGPCWCDTEGVPMGLRNLISIEKRMKACICPKCVETYKQDIENRAG